MNKENFRFISDYFGMRRLFKYLNENTQERIRGLLSFGWFSFALFWFLWYMPRRIIMTGMTYTGRTNIP